MIYEWMPAGILVAENFTVNDFTVDSEVRNETEVFSLSTGNFTTISMSVRLERRALPYLIKYFAPIILTTILSMIPIGDPKNKSLAVLTSFLLTSILTVLINIHVVPKGVTVTAFDAFGFVCVIFTAVSLVFTLRKSAETEGSTYKLSDREEKCEQHMKKLLPIAFVSFLLILLIVVTCL